MLSSLDVQEFGGLADMITDDMSRMYTLNCN